MQELGYDDDVDFDLREELEEAIGGELLTEEDHDVVDSVLLWWRDSDGDLVDGSGRRPDQPAGGWRRMAADPQVGPGRPRAADGYPGGSTDRRPARHQDRGRVPRLGGLPAGGPPQELGVAPEPHAGSSVPRPPEGTRYDAGPAEGAATAPSARPGTGRRRAGVPAGEPVR